MQTTVQFSSLSRLKLPYSFSLQAEAMQASLHSLKIKTSSLKTALRGCFLPEPVKKTASKQPDFAPSLFQSHDHVQVWLYCCRGNGHFIILHHSSYEFITLLQQI